VLLLLDVEVLPFIVRVLVIFIIIINVELPPSPSPSLPLSPVHPVPL
jgi:hypothetical protein